jgi:hypothetical protein
VQVRKRHWHLRDAAPLVDFVHVDEIGRLTASSILFAQDSWDKPAS